MSTYEDDIAAALIGGVDPDTAINRSTLRYAVGKQIFDNATGAVLDIRTAVLVTVTRPDGKRAMEVFDGARYDAQAEQLAAMCAEGNITLEISDGRVLFADEPGATTSNTEPQTTSGTQPTTAAVGGCRCPQPSPEYGGEHLPGCGQGPTAQ